jgi:hypothetical protein
MDLSELKANIPGLPVGSHRMPISSLRGINEQGDPRDAFSVATGLGSSIGFELRWTTCKAASSDGGPPFLIRGIQRGMRSPKSGSDLDCSQVGGGCDATRLVTACIYTKIAIFPYRRSRGSRPPRTSASIPQRMAPPFREEPSLCDLNRDDLPRPG